MPFTPPQGRDIDFYRGNFCGIRVKGAPAVAGSNDQNPELVMAALLDNYPQRIQEKYLELYAGYGYTHLQRSLSHALGYGHSTQEFAALSRKAKAFGLFVDTWFIANEFPGFQPNQDASFWAPRLDPHIDLLTGEGAIDLACPSWQMDQVNSGAPGNATLSVIKYVADKLPGVPIYTHWVNEALAWWKTGGEVWADEHGSLNVMDRFTWWYACRPYLTGGHHQGNTTMARAQPKLYQDKMLDTLDYFGGDTGKGNMGQSLRSGTPQSFKLTVFECTAQDQFNGTCSEDEGDRVGYQLMCTTGKNAHLSGYGNGARMPDGGTL